MLKVVYFAGMALAMVLVETVLFPTFGWFSKSFDLMIIPVLLLSVTYTHYLAVAAIIFMGIVMDSLSGSAFFFHVFSYVWIYIMVQLFRQFVFHGSVIFIFIISLVSVLIQQGLSLFAIFIRHGKDGILQTDGSLMAGQILFGAVFIPIGFWTMQLFLPLWMDVTASLRRSFRQRYRS